jgi:hypothetical protein
VAGQGIAIGACLRAGAALALTAVAAILGPASAADARPACFGAASRDPHHHCANPKLRTMVVPTPGQAELMPSAPCTPLEAPIEACTFGTPPEEAQATVALLGDSHADHWRASLWPVTRALGWTGVSLTYSSCPLTRAVPVGPHSKQHACAAFNRGVRQWLTNHPTVSTVITSNHLRHVVHARGTSERRVRLAGVVAALRKLPPSVKHIIVIRDVPFAREPTLVCVRRAMRKHRNAGRACAFSRKQKLHEDAYVQAAKKLHSARIQVVDMTHFFCGRRLCFPVVGGVLVYRDSFGHITTVYGKTLAPYLLAKVMRAMAAWR